MLVANSLKVLVDMCKVVLKLSFMRTEPIVV